MMSILPISFKRRAGGVIVWWGLTTLTALPALAQSVSGSVALVAADGKASQKPDHSGVLVWLEASGPVSRPAAAAPKQATMAQRNKTFLPHLLVVEVGTAVDLPNDDPTFHNVFSNYDGQVFDVQVYAPQTSRRVVFRRPGMVHVFCNIHEAMNAVIAVLPSPFFAVTGRDGRFEIQAPAGSYRLRLWHERVERDVAGKLEQTVTLGPGVSAIPGMAMALSNQPVVPH